MSYLSDDQRDWWYRRDPEEEDPTAHEKLKAVFRVLDDRGQRKRAMLLYGGVYGDATPSFGGAWSVDAHVRAIPSMGGQLSLNVSRSVVDAVKSRIFAKSKPHLSYATEGGGPERQHNAQLLERGVDGVFYQSGFYAKAVRCGRDGCVYGHGLLRIEADHERRETRVLRWRPWDLLVDDGEALLPEIRSYYARHYEDRARLAALVRAGHMAEGDLEAKAALIDAIESSKDDDAEYGYEQVVRRVRVLEAWRKPNIMGGDDGRYILAVENCTLIDRPWDGEGFPFAGYSWSDPLEGYYGQGLIEIGLGIQEEINKLLREIQEGHHFITGHWLVEANSKVIAAHVNNDLRRIMRYQGMAPPTYVAPAIIAPEVYQHLWNLVGRYYTVAGVNEQSAAAQKPAGLDSGEAQRVYADQQTETLLDKGARYEDFVRECGALVTRAAKHLAAHGAYEVRSMRDDGYEIIDWKKLDDPDGYELRVSPTSSLPGTLAGKIAFANDLLKLGQVDGADIMEIVGMGDMLSETNMKLASRRLTKKRIGEMLRDGRPYAPHAFLNLDESIAVARDMLNDAEFRDVDDERLQLLRDFIEASEIEKSKRPPSAAPAAAPGGGALMAPGQPGAAAPGAPPIPAAPPAQAA